MRDRKSTRLRDRLRCRFIKRKTPKKGTVSHKFEEAVPFLLHVSQYFLEAFILRFFVFQLLNSTLDLLQDLLRLSSRVRIERFGLLILRFQSKLLQACLNASQRSYASFNLRCYCQKSSPPPLTVLVYNGVIIEQGTHYYEGGNQIPFPNDG